MATKQEIMDVLDDLRTRYPHAKIPDPATMIRNYVEDLADIPAWLLKKAAKVHRQVSHFFPKVPELRLAAAVEAGLTSYRDGVPQGGFDFSSVEDKPIDYLMAEYYELTDDFYHRGLFDGAAFETLARRLDDRERTSMAATVRQKAEAFERDVR